MSKVKKRKKKKLVYGTLIIVIIKSTLEQWMQPLGMNVTLFKLPMKQGSFCILENGTQ